MKFPFLPKTVNKMEQGLKVGDKVRVATGCAVYGPQHWADTQLIWVHKKGTQVQVVGGEFFTIDKVIKWK